MNDEICDHDEDDNDPQVMVVYARVEPWSTYDLLGHLVGGVAASVGAWANALAGISNDLFAAGRDQRAQAALAEAEEAQVRALVRTRIEIDSLPTFEGDR